MKVKRGRKMKRPLIVKVLVAPFRALCKATDFYMKTLMDCQGSGGGYGMAVNCHAQMFTVTVPPAPKYSSVNLRKRRREKEDSKEMMFQLIQTSNCSAQKRSYSFEIGKIGMIDEDKSCSFRKDDDDYKL